MVDYAAAVLEEETRIIEKLKDRSDELERVVEELDSTILELEEDKIADKICGILFYEEMGSELENLVINGFISAAVTSGEFNFAPYIAQLEIAVRANMENIVKWYYNGENWNFMFDPSYLGDVVEWAAAVRAARGTAPTRGKPITDNARFRYPYEEIDEPELSTRMWAEKYYGVDREGKHVIRVRFKSKRDEKTGKFVKSDETEEVDVTERFKGKYTKTINDRISFLRPDKAPFWYIIEHGNSSLNGFDDVGDPYPIVYPNPIEMEIRSMFDRIWDEVYTHYRYEAEDLIFSAIYKTLGIKRKTPSYKNISDDLRDYIEEQLEDIVEGREAGTAPSQGKVTKTGETLISTTNMLVERTKTGSISTKLRGAHGHFIKIGS